MSTKGCPVLFFICCKWINRFTDSKWFGLAWWCLASLSTIFQLDRGGACVLLVEETGGPWENHRSVAYKSNSYAILCILSLTFFFSQLLSLMKSLHLSVENHKYQYLILTLLILVACYRYIVLVVLVQYN